MEKNKRDFIISELMNPGFIEDKNQERYFRNRNVFRKFGRNESVISEIGLVRRESFCLKSSM